LIHTVCTGNVHMLMICDCSNTPTLQHYTNNLTDKKAQLTQGLLATALTRDSAVIPRWPSVAILDIIELKIASADPENTSHRLRDIRL